MQLTIFNGTLILFYYDCGMPMGRMAVIALGEMAVPKTQGIICQLQPLDIGKADRWWSSAQRTAAKYVCICDNTGGRQYILYVLFITYLCLASKVYIYIWQLKWASTIFRSWASLSLLADAFVKLRIPNRQPFVSVDHFQYLFLITSTWNFFLYNGDQMNWLDVESSMSDKSSRWDARWHAVD